MRHRVCKVGLSGALNGVWMSGDATIRASALPAPPASFVGGMGSCERLGWELGTPCDAQPPAAMVLVLVPRAQTQRWH